MEAILSLAIIIVDYLAIVEAIAREAGAMSKSAFAAPKLVQNKDSTAQDLVTETDRAVENLVRRRLQENFPDFLFIGEETHIAGSGISAEPTWIVDPIDGTTNFVHGMPFFCVSIGLCVGKVPVLGVVYNPMSDELFSAARGHGATLNGRPIHVNQSARTLGSSLLLTEFTTKEKAEATVRDVLLLMQHCRSIRMMGAAAIDLCFVAAGRSDGFLEKGIKCWDIAAGTVIVREAGGYVTDYEGEQPFDLYKGEVIATTCPEVAHAVIKLLRN